MEAARQAWATRTGADGLALLAALSDERTPPARRVLPAVETLRQVRAQHVLVEQAPAGPRLVWRAKDNVQQVPVLRGVGPAPIFATKSECDGLQARANGP